MKISQECNCLKAIELIRQTHAQHERKGFSLQEKLKRNREKMGTGSGDAYWGSVVQVVEEHYKS